MLCKTNQKTNQKPTKNQPKTNHEKNQPKTNFVTNHHQPRNIEVGCRPQLTVCRVYPEIGISMTDNIDECRTAQQVFVRAKSLLDPLPTSVTSEGSAAFAGKTYDKKNAPKSDIASVKKSIKALTDQISKLVNAVALFFLSKGSRSI